MKKVLIPRCPYAGGIGQQCLESHPWWPPPVRGILALFSAYESRYGCNWKIVLDLY